MTRLTRPALGLMLLAGLAAPSPAAEVDPMLPAESEGVVFVNVRQILDSKLIQTYALGQIQQALKGNDAQEQMKKLGLDPLKDIDRVTGGFWGKSQEDMNGLFVIRGKFDPAKLMAAAEEEAKKEPEKLEIITEGGVKLIKVNSEEENNPLKFMTVASAEAIVAGSDPKLVAGAATAGKAKDAKPAIKPELAELVAAQDGSASMFFCGLTDGKVELPPGMDLSALGLDSAKLAKQLEKMASMAMTVRLTQDVSLDLNMGMKDGGAAKEFAETVEQLLNTAKAFLPIIANQQPAMQPLVQDVVKSLKGGADGKAVTVSLKVTSDSIGKVAGGGAE